MIAVEDTALVLLAAGRSRRWGAIDSKLDTVFLGRPLGIHVAIALEHMPFKARIAVTGRATLDYAAHRFDVVTNDDPDSTMAASVRLGVARAAELGAGAMLIALADMPRVPAGHVRRLFDATDGPDSVVASSDGRHPKPPAIFGHRRFDKLLALKGDAGARELIAAGRHVTASPAELVDIDTQAEFERLCEATRHASRPGGY